MIFRMERPANWPPPALILTIFASCGLACAIPYDAAFDRVTGGVPLLRGLAMLCCWIAGLWLLRANKLSLAPTGLKRPLLTIAAAAIGVATWCIVMDGILFRSILPAGYHAFEQTPLSLRLLYYCSRALNENVLYRLLAGAAFAWVLRRIWCNPKYGLALTMAGMTIAHVINIALNTPLSDPTPATLTWVALRFVAPGVLWSWLYVRHSFATNEGAAIGVHLILQPLASIAF